MYGCESWTIKKAECPRMDAFELWYWRRLLRVPWTAKRSNQSILKEISPENSLEGLMLKLRLHYFGHLMWRKDSLEKTLMLGKTEAGGNRDDRGWAGWMASLTRWTWVWASPGSWWWTGKPDVLQSMGLKGVGHNWVTELIGTRRGFPGGSAVKNLPAMEMWVWFPGQEDPLEKEMATHSSILAWEIPWTEEAGGLQFMGSQKSPTRLKRLKPSPPQGLGIFTKIVLKCVTLSLKTIHGAQTMVPITLFSPQQVSMLR